MLVTFSSDEYENITMFGEVAKRLIVMMGHTETVPGAIMANDVPDALVRLQAAIEQEKKSQSLAKQEAENSEDTDEEPRVSLAHRALPLINMLKAASEHKHNVMWKSGV